MNAQNKSDVGYAMWVLFALNQWLENNFHGGVARSRP
jgi:hypothetical protein